MKLTLKLFFFSLFLCFAGTITGQQSETKVEQDSIEEGKGDTENLKKRDGVLSYNWESGRITFGGVIHRTVMYVADGINNDIFFMDSEQPPTQLKMNIENNLNDNISVFGKFLIGLQSNRPIEVSQDNKNPGVVFRAIISEVGFRHSKIGSIELGRGFTSSSVFNQADLSGTSTGSLIAIGNLAPGMKFVDRDANELSDRQVFNYFFDTQRLFVADRIRFDSNSFGGGFILAGSLAADDRWDASLRYFPKAGKFTFRGVVTYEQKPFRDINSRTVLGFGLRHEKSGVNISALGSYGETTDQRDPYGYVVKAGVTRSFTELGNTAFSMDYTQNKDAVIEGEKASSYGFFANQSIDPIRVVVYAGYRKYEVKETDLNLIPLNTMTLGISFSF